MKLIKGVLEKAPKSGKRQMVSMGNNITHILVKERGKAWEIPQECPR